MNSSQNYNAPETEFIYRDERYEISGFVDPTGEFYILEFSSITQSKLLFSEAGASKEHCIENLRKLGF